MWKTRQKIEMIAVMGLTIIVVGSNPKYLQSVATKLTIEIAYTVTKRHTVSTIYTVLACTGRLNHWLGLIGASEKRCMVEGESINVTANRASLDDSWERRKLANVAAKIVKS